MSAVGRLPQGSLVQVNAVYETDGDSALVSLGQSGDLDFEVGVIGYEDDIQPIFERACSVCHSGLVQTMGLQVTEYEPLMAGSDNGPVVVPGKLDESRLWELVSTRQMPMIGELSDLDLATIKLWIEAGSPERRSALPNSDSLWLTVLSEDVEEVENACDGGLEGADNLLVSADLILPMSCGTPPDSGMVEAMAAALVSGGEVVSVTSSADAPSAGAVAAPPHRPLSRA